MCYYYGVGVVRDYTQALSWFLKAAEQGLVQARGKVRRMYEAIQVIYDENLELALSTGGVEEIAIFRKNRCEIKMNYCLYVEGYYNKTNNHYNTFILHIYLNIAISQE